ncbi:MAG: cupin domain-containing protein [Actinomycetota bacterium]|nr:cupin domain-containing protein [Rubrobacter sp.]MDQ3507759.1 cupin domain-containing protein [Actinomycetota bacterium]
MKIVSRGESVSKRAPEEWFTGRAWMEPSPAEPPEAGVFRVLFEPGARTNWHTHPEGQIIHIVSGKCRAGNEDGSVVEASEGDTVCFGPGEKHWHGAAPDSFMVHIAINPAANSDGGTDWMESVGDEEYGAVR